MGLPLPVAAGLFDHGYLARDDSGEPARIIYYSGCVHRYGSDEWLIGGPYSPWLIGAGPMGETVVLCPSIESTVNLLATRDPAQPSRSGGRVSIIGLGPGDTGEYAEHWLQKFVGRSRRFVLHGDFSDRPNLLRALHLAGTYLSKSI